MDRLHRLLFERRRLIAAALAGLAVVAAVSAVREDRPTHRVVVAAHDLASGRTLASDDVRVVRFPADAVPDHAVDDVDAVRGRVVAGPMRAGEVVTDRRVLDRGRVDGYAGDVLTTIRVAEADGLTTVRPGDRVDVVAVDPHGERSAEVVARGVDVVTVPSPTDDPAGRPVRLATDEATALRLATVALEARFTLLSAG